MTLGGKKGNRAKTFLLVPSVYQFIYMVDNLAVISAVWIFRSNAIKGLHPATFQGIKGPSNKCPHHFLPVCVSLIFRGNIADGDGMCE